MASTAGPAAAGEAILRDQIRTDAHGVEQAHAARVRRARRLAELKGVEPQRVYRVDPGMDPAAYDPKELYLHLRDAHDLRLDAARKAPYAPPAPTVLSLRHKVDTQVPVTQPTIPPPVALVFHVKLTCPR